MLKQLTFEDLKNNNLDLRIIPPDRLFEIADAKMLMDLGKVEDNRFERKSAKYGPKELGEYFSMWSNTPPGGLIVVGQEDNGELSGVFSLSTKQINDIDEAASIYCPDAIYKHKRVPFKKPDGSQDAVIIFFVEYNRTRAVATSSGKIFVRVGSKKKELRKEAEIKHLRQEKNEVSAELEIVNLQWPKDFDVNAIDIWVNQVILKEGLSENYHTREDILANNQLGEQNQDGFRPYLACALLFAKKPKFVISGAYIRFLRFDGKEQGSGSKWNATKDETINGTIPTQINECAALLRSQLRDFSKLINGKFYTAPEYPDEAWYEAIVNACVHRTYSNGLRNSPIFVRMFDDRLEVESPGPLPPLVTPQNIYQMHNPRNPRVMNAMRFMGLVKMAHEGTRRMRDTMTAMELPAPEFTQQEIGNAMVRVTLRNSIELRRVWVDGDVAELIGAGLTRTLNQDEKRCVNWAAENGGRISVSDAQRLTQKSWPAAQLLLKSLKDRGIFTVHRKSGKRDPQARYVLIGFDKS